MRVMLQYGKTGLEVEAPEDAAVLRPKSVPGLADEREAVVRALRAPAGGRPLRESVRARDRVAIVISDITRPTPNHKLVPWLLDELAHVPRANITVINGTGTHRDQTREEFVAMLGAPVVEQVRVINHHCSNADELSVLGRSRFGCPIALNRAYVEADFRIATGFIEPHFFAGFSGGPKGIMPAIAGLETILAFHSPAMIGHPRATWGILDGNPLQEMAREVNDLCKPDFLLNVALNDDKEIANVWAGELYATHAAGCAYVREHAMIACRERFDVVVTTNSGYPLDQNLYQAVKGMSAAHKIVKRGGAIICAAECADGVPAHGNFARILKMGRTPREILELVESGSVRMMDQWQAQKQAVIQMWADVYMHSSLPPAVVEDALLTPVADIADALDALRRRNGGRISVAVLPSGPQSIPYVAAEEAVTV